MVCCEHKHREGRGEKLGESGIPSFPFLTNHFSNSIKYLVPLLHGEMVRDRATLTNEIGFVGQITTLVELVGANVIQSEI